MCAEHAVGYVRYRGDGAWLRRGDREETNTNFFEFFMYNFSLWGWPLNQDKRTRGGSNAHLAQLLLCVECCVWHFIFSRRTIGDLIRPFWGWCICVS